MIWILSDQLMDRTQALSCTRAGQHEGARHHAQEAMLQIAARSENMQRKRASGLLELAFPGFRQMMESDHETGPTKGVSRRNDDGAPATFCMTTQLIRAMNNCIGMHFGISEFDSALGLSRLITVPELLRMMSVRPCEPLRPHPMSNPGRILPALGTGSI
jgi:hypothetical protein